MLLLYILLLIILFFFILFLMFCIPYSLYKCYYYFNPDIKITPNNDYSFYNEYFMKKFQNNYIKHTQFIQNNLDEKFDNITIEDGNHLSDESSSDESSLISDTSSNYSDDSSVISENSTKFDTISIVEKYNYS